MALHFLLRRSKSDGQEHSLDVQRAGCQAFATARGFGARPVEHVSDGIAGDDAEGMVALHRLLATVRSGDVVICRDQSRLGREAIEVTLTVRNIVRDAGARLFYYTSGQEVACTGVLDSAMTFISGVGAQLELEAIRSRVREALRSRVKQARIAGGHCYGYERRRVADSSGGTTVMAVVNDQEADVIRRIFAEFIAGAGYKRIAIGLNDDGIPFPRVGKRGSGSWSAGQVRDVLRRERYVGVYVHGLRNRVKKGGKRITLRETDPTKIMRQDIPEWRIVDDITWRRAQSMITVRAPREARPAQNSENRSTSVLGGIARCGVCGGAIGVVQSRSGVRPIRAYGCITHRQRGSAVCPARTIRPVEAVEQAVADAIRLVAERPDVLEVIMGAVRAEVEAQALAAATTDIGQLEDERAQLRRRARGLGDAIASCAGDEHGVPPQLLDQLKATNARAVQLEKQLAAAARAPIEAAAYIASAQAAVLRELADLRGVLAAGGLSRELVKGSIDDLAFTPTADHRWIGTATFDVRKGLATPEGFGAYSRAPLPMRFTA